MPKNKRNDCELCPANTLEDYESQTYDCLIRDTSTFTHCYWSNEKILKHLDIHMEEFLEECRKFVEYKVKESE